MYRITYVGRFEYESQKCESDCVAAAGGMLASTWGRSARSVAAHLREVLDACGRGGVLLEDAAAVLRRDVKVPAILHRGKSFGEALRFAKQGAVLIGIDPMVLEGQCCSPVGHAVILQGSLAVRDALGRVHRRVRVTDPSPVGGRDQYLQPHAVKRAYEFGGSELVWLPSADLVRSVVRHHPRLRLRGRVEIVG